MSYSQVAITIITKKTLSMIEHAPKFKFQIPNEKLPRERQNTRETSSRPLAGTSVATLKENPNTCRGKYHIFT